MANPKTLKKIHDYFSLFPDGWIHEFTGDADCLKLKIDCEYLGEVSNLKYSFFYVELVQIHRLDLSLWTKPSDLQPVLLTEIEDIFAKKLGIVTSRLQSDCVELVCTQEFRSEGHISLACEYISVFDQRMQEVTVNQLRKICSKYGIDF